MDELNDPLISVPRSTLEDCVSILRGFSTLFDYGYMNLAGWVATREALGEEFLATVVEHHPIVDPDDELAEISAVNDHVIDVLHAIDDLLDGPVQAPHVGSDSSP
jgi:hypothetical protein